MKKLFFVLCLVILTGCQNPAKNLQANIFGDLWDKYVTEQDEHIMVTRTKFYSDLYNYRVFAELNDKLDNLHNFLIVGKYETSTDKISLKNIDDSFRVIDLEAVFCEEGKEKVQCFIQGETQKNKVFCFNDNDEELTAVDEKIKYCESREKNEFQEGLMKLADKNNEALIEEFRGIIDTFQKDASSQKSLEQEFKKLKSNINRVCQKQKVSVNCGF